MQIYFGPLHTYVHGHVRMLSTKMKIWISSLAQ